MRKRRVLALLLALSLVVSGNGMTVLAAEQGADMPVSVSQEETQDIEDNSEEKEDASGSTEEASGTEDTSGETNTPEEGSPSDEEGKNEEGDTSQNPENPDNAGEEEPSAPKDEDGEQDGDKPSTEDGEQNGDQPSTEDGEQNDDQPSTEDGEDGKQDEAPDAETQDPAEDVQEPSVSENDVEEAEEPEEELEEKSGEVRMMTFTDASGLQITFDANAAEENADNLVIDENGVLTGIKEGATVEGVIDLRKKTDITAIGKDALAGSAVTYVMLPSTITSIGENGFSGCASLKGISIPSTRLKTIGEGAFQNCERLTQLAIPNSVTSIEAGAFKGDTRLFMVNMESADYSVLTTIGDNAFEGCSVLEFFCSDDEYNLPASLKTIGAYAFKNCVKIDEVDMGDGVTSLGEGAYYGCIGIKEVEISACVGTVPASAFGLCGGLTEVEFSTKVLARIEIAGSAFIGCSKLGSVELPQNVGTVRTDAFKDCTALRRVQIDDNFATLEVGAFPNNNKDLCIVGRSKESAAAKYARENGGLRFILLDGVPRKEYYTYTKWLSGANVDTGLVKLKVATSFGDIDKVKDINDIANSDATDKDYQKGVVAGTECYIIYSVPQGTRLVSGSLQCNGEEIKRNKSGQFTFAMPVGGAAISAEFEMEMTGDSVVDGTAETIEGRLSSEVDYDYENNIGTMKVGQTAKFYLINTKDGGLKRIPTSQITYQIAPYSSSGVLSVTKDGTIKALKEGSGTVEAEVNTPNGKVKVPVSIKVGETDIDHINIMVETTEQDKDSDVRPEWIEKDESGNIVGISIPKTDAKDGLEIDIEAAAFSTKENAVKMKVPFTWSSSDTKVAKLEKSSTAEADSENEIKIPVGADGEATITVSAKDKNNNKITRKFVVSVQSYEPRLTASKITVNPKQDEGSTTIGIIDAYGKAISANQTIEAVDNAGQPIHGFVFKKVGKEGVVTTYSVSVLASVVEKTYDVRLKVSVDGLSKEFYPPLKIVVKKSEPKPTVSFDKKAPKINLFLANDGVEIHPVVGKLGDHKVSEYSLEPLTQIGHKNYDDDKLFTENFRIDPQDGTITQKVPNLKTDGKGKPVLKGKLILKFEGFGDLKKEYTITIPTQTVAPAYVLDKTSGTFGTDMPKPMELTLLDKKTKKPVAWDAAYHIDEESKSTCTGVTPSLAKGTGVIDGVEQEVVKIKLEFRQGFTKGKLYIRLTNDKWAAGKLFTYTYNVKTDVNPAKIKLKKNTITLNTNYPKNKAEFELVSNHDDTDMTGDYEFIAQPTSKNGDVFKNLTIKCKDGKGDVFFGKEGTSDYSFVNSIPAGNYKYLYTHVDANRKTNKITLTVKVEKTTPTVSLKGSNALNLRAYKNGENGEKIYVEASEMTVTVKKLPNVEKWLEKPGENTGGNDSGTENGGNGDSTENPGGGSGGGDNVGDGDNTGSGDGGSEGSGEGGGTVTPGEGGDGDNTGSGDGGNDGSEGSGTVTPGDGGTGGENVGTDQPQSQIRALSTTDVSGGKINPEYYLFDAETTFKYIKNDSKSIQFTTRGFTEENPLDYFTFTWVEGEKASEGKIRISLKKALPAKTYNLKMTPTYKNGINPKPVQTAKPVSFNIKVYSDEISVTLRAKGKINLLNREAVEKNGIQYTPVFKNLKDTIQEVRLLDESDGKRAEWDQPERISRQFTPIIAEDGKSFYIVPTAGADLENRKSYQLRIWIKTNGYVFPSDGGGKYVPNNVRVNTAEVLPKVKTDKTATDLYMSSKAYEATFLVQKSDEKSIGAIESVAFAENDEKANDSFTVWGVPRDDGSLEVHLKLKNGVSYGCNTTNRIKMYIQFTGQGTNTAGTPITMNVKINK